MYNQIFGRTEIGIDMKHLMKITGIIFLILGSLLILENVFVFPLVAIYKLYITIGINWMMMLEYLGIYLLKLVISSFLIIVGWLVVMVERLWEDGR